MVIKFDLPFTQPKEPKIDWPETEEKLGVVTSEDIIDLDRPPEVEVTPLNLIPEGIAPHK